MKKVQRSSHDPFMIHPLHSARMNSRRSSFLRRSRLTMGLAALFVLSGGFNTGYVSTDGVAAAAAGGGGSSHATAGTYVVQVAGSFNGTGQASVGSGKVHITATVTDTDGHSGTLKADLTINANHFKGAGTITTNNGSVDMVIEGRADSADQKKNNAGRPNEVQIGPRILASFKTSDDRAGRIFGRPNNGQQPN